MLPTAVVLIVLMIVKVLSDQRVLFASLASSAYSIYLSPENRSNSIRCLVSSQLAAAVAGIGFDALLGANYYAAGLSMVSTVAVTIAADVFHPPATATALSFAFRSNKITSLRLFVLCLVMVAILIGLQRATLKAVARLSRRRPEMASRADTR